MNKKKVQIWLPLLLSVAMIAGMFLGFKIKSGMPGRNFFSVEKASPMDEVAALIRNKYVDKVDISAIGDSAIIAMLAQLDPHSAYIPAAELARVNEDINGSFFGIGIEFKILYDTMHVTNVLPEGPSAQAGLQIGDRILKANDSVLTGKQADINKIRSFLKGELGSKVVLNVLRQGQQKVVNVQRGVIPITSIDAAYMIDGKTGYIRLNRFSSQTYREFMLSLEKLKKQGLAKLILDLRDNGGGVLDEAVEIADEFLSGDKLITYTEGVHSPKKDYRCRREGQFETGELVVLANESSASASEILLGALQDWDRATIIGRTTFGKGLVQDQYNLSDNSALRLTIARYYTPVGRSIQRSYADGKRAYYEAAYHHSENSADTTYVPTGKKFKTMGGKPIYSNGGITPDVFVAADTMNIGLLTAKLYGKGTVVDFGYQYYLQDPKVLTDYKTPENFVQKYILKEENWQLFEALAKRDSIDLSKVSVSEKDYILKQLKLSLARQLYRSEGFYETANREDKTVQKALELLNKK